MSKQKNDEMAQQLLFQIQINLKLPHKIQKLQMDHEGSLQDFQIQKKLGEGAFGQVFLVRRKLDNQVYALKKVKLLGMKEKQKENALNEIRILASLNDEYIVKFKQAFFDSISNCLCIVMEYAKGGDLMKLINNHIKSHTRISQQEIWKAIVDILKGLKSLHDKKILHRDLKSANIFISEEGKYKLGDLNVSKVLKKGLAYTQTGTPYYASPQVWQDLPYDMKSDIWSLGCVIYELATLQPPFKASDLQGLYKKVKAGQYKPISSNYSSQLAEIIGHMLKVKPKDRLGTDQLLKLPIVKRKCGVQITEIDMKNYYQKGDELLKTIKFNPYNMKSINMNLPKSSYGKEGESKKPKDRNDSLDSLDYLKKDRALSACGVRNQTNRALSPSGQHRDINSNKIISQPTNVQKPVGMNLPPKPQRKTQKTEEVTPRDPGARLRRVGEEILGRGERASSVNR